MTEINSKTTAKQQHNIRIIELLIFLTNLVFLVSSYALANIRIPILFVWLLFSVTYIIYGIKAKRNLFSLFLGKEFTKPFSFFKLVFDQLLPFLIFIILFGGFAYDALSKDSIFPRSVTLERQRELVEYDKAVLLYFTTFAIVFLIIEIVIIFRQKKIR
jgi:hypothetical protein